MQTAAPAYYHSATLIKPVYSEKNGHTKKGVNYSYFGARYYDSDLSVWLSVDPYCKKYPHLSPYCAFENRPIVLIDPGGDTTIYYSRNGERLHTSYDALPTSIVVIPNNTVFSFKKYVAHARGLGIENENSTNAGWRKLGWNIPIQQFRDFFSSHRTPGVHNKNASNEDGVNAGGLYNEYKANLYIKDNSITLGSIVITSDEPMRVIGDPDLEPNLGKLIGDSHLHQNEGLPVEFGHGAYAPSPIDINNQSGLNIIVGREQIYIYGNGIKPFAIRKDNLLRGFIEQNQVQ
jgi:RHS repeat-associated protein